jgi:guanylate kinase
MNQLDARGNLFIVSAPSGAGKTSLVKALVESLPDICFSVSHTTRPRRPGEREGIDYHFVEVASFEQMAAEGRFLEYARVFGNYYGTSRDLVEARLRQGQDVVLDIDWQGARQVRRAVPDCIGIFILPPSLDELARRLRHRAQDDDAIIRQRLQAAVNEIKHYDEYDYLLINDRFEPTLEQLRAVFLATRARLAVQQRRHARLIAELLA